jgi:thiol-disulfide isomerase/thioredoxin
MKKLLIITLCFLQANALLAQQKFTIRGKVSLLANSKNIHVGNITAPIQSDGTFTLSGEVPEAKMDFIKTDSSSMTPMWLEAGDYVYDCRESRRLDRSITLKATLKSAPTDAAIFGRFRQLADENFLTDASKGPAMQQKTARAYADSIFKNYPTAKFLPAVIFGVNSFVGVDATKRYMALLPPEMKKDALINGIQNDINRADKLAKGVFDDFAMKTADGKDFNLSSLKDKKVIIIDFWAKWCAPCRAGHPKLVDLYKKYADKGLEIVSISLDNNTADWLSAMKEDNIGNWVNVSDQKAWQTELVKNYFIDYIPFCLIINGDRKILKVYQGGSKPTEKDILAGLK